MRYAEFISGNTSRPKRRWAVLKLDKLGLLFLSITLSGLTLGQGRKPSAAAEKPAETAKPSKGATRVPAGQELVSIDFPEPTEIKDIIRAVSLWTGKNVILGKNVSGKVQMISPKKVTKEEAYQAFLSALNIIGLTTVETGKVIKILPTRKALKGNLQIFQGTTWAPRTDKMITQIVPLKYIDVKQLQTTLSRMATSNSMIAFPSTNTLIISDAGYKVRRLLSIIEMLDVQGQQPKVAIVRILYADAKSIASKVQAIFKVSSGKKGAGKSYNTYKISVDERSNSVVIFGPPRTISDVKALVKKFDFPLTDLSGQSAIRVRFLDYADAKKLSATLSSLASGSRSRSKVPSLGRKKSKTNNSVSVANLGNDVKITADESSNALLITGSRADYDSINTLIRKLDQRRAQVYVEADILDVSLDNGFKFESSVLGGSASGNKGTSIGWQAGTVGAISSSGDGTTTTAQAAAVSSVGSDFTIGVLSSQTFKVGGIELTPGALIKMIKRDSNTRILATPHLLANNNEEASITVGKKIYYKTITAGALAGGGASEKVEKADAELSLQMRPVISNSGNYVTFKLDLTVDDGELNQFGVPDIKTRKTSQWLTVKNSQTAVISGLVRNSEGESYQKIPFLGDIPILGWLFRNTSINKSVTSLMIFIRANIVYGANDLAAIYAEKVKDRDKLMSAAFGPNEYDQFLRNLPSLTDGRYIPDAYDDLELRNRQTFLESLRRDMGFTNAEVDEMKKTDKEKKIERELQKDLSLPSAVISSPDDTEPAAPEASPEPVEPAESGTFDDNSVPLESGGDTATGTEGEE